jgi:hypothetical protein
MNQVHNFAHRAEVPTGAEILHRLNDDESDRMTTIWRRAADMKTVIQWLAESRGVPDGVADILWTLHREFDAIEALSGPRDHPHFT